jgi:uncharacterized protein (DUF2384 family)
LVGPKLGLGALHTQEHVDELWVSDRNRLVLPHEYVELAARLVGTPASRLSLDALHERVIPGHQLRAVLFAEVLDQAVDIVGAVRAELMCTVPNFGADVVPEKRVQSLVPRAARSLAELIEQASRNAELVQRVLIVGAVPKEAAVRDDGVDRRFCERRSGETARRVEGLCMGEELCRPVHGTPKTGRRAMPESMSMLGILESLGRELLGVRPSAFRLEEEKLKAACLPLRV